VASDEQLSKLEEKYDGYTVNDRDGDKIGKVDELFVDETDREEYIGVKMGLLGISGTTLIPLEMARVDEQDRVIEVSESKERVKDAPPIATTTRSTTSSRTESAATSASEPRAPPDNAALTAVPRVAGWLKRARTGARPIARDAKTVEATEKEEKGRVWSVESARVGKTAGTEERTIETRGARSRNPAAGSPAIWSLVAENLMIWSLVARGRARNRNLDVLVKSAASGKRKNRASA